MTELNNYPEAESDRTEVIWPAAPVHAGVGNPVNGNPVNGNPDTAGPAMANPAGAAETADSDAAVATLLDRLGAIPGLAVSEHGAAYADLHDALLAALNDDDPSTAGEA